MLNYSLFLNDIFGERLEDISSFISLDYTRVENDFGSLTAIVPATFDRRLLTVDARIEAIRRNLDGKSKRDTDTIWLLQDWVEIYSGDNKYYQLMAYDANHLFARRYIPYAAESSYTKKTDNADDIIKAIMRENYGTLAKLPTEVTPTTVDTARDISTYLTIDADLGLAPSVTAAFAQAKVIDALKQIVNASGNAGTELFFDIVAVTAKTLVFRTYISYRGVNRTSNDVKFTPQNGTLFNAKISTAYSKEQNYIYAKGQGQASERLFVTASDTARIAKSPLNRREGFVDGRSNAGTTVLQSEANSALFIGKPTTILDAELRDTENARYGIDWNWGDYVPVNAGGNSFNCHVRAVNVSIKDGKESIRAILRGIR